MNRPKPALLGLLLALAPCAAGASVLFASTGCDEKATTTRAAAVDASATDKYVTADPKLEKALQAAASDTAATDNGPPPSGIFPPGAADKKHPKGVATTVETVSDGTEPRVTLAGPSPDTARSSSYGPAALELTMQMGPRTAMPTVDMGLALGPAKKDDGGNDWLVADVKTTSPAKDQLGELPPGTDKAIATLESTQLRVKLAPGGDEVDLDTRLSKQARPELERIVQSAVEALVFATVPLPSKPVGVDARWIAETRMPLSGLDVIAYRAYRIKSIDGSRVRLSMDVKAYAASTDTKLQGVPPDATLKQIDATAQGEMELMKGEVLARKSDVQQRVVLIFEVPGAAGAAPQPGEPPEPGQPPATKTATAQMLGQATFVRGEDLRAALRP